MKILHLMGVLRPSGMERMFISASPYFQQAGVRSVIVGQGPDHPYQPELVAAGYETVTIPPMRSRFGIFAWIRRLRMEQPDVIHIHNEGTFLLSVIGAKLALPKVPIVRSVHNVFNASRRSRISRRLQSRIVDRFVAEFIAVSPDVQVHEQELGRSARLVFNWVDDHFFQARDVKPFMEQPETPAAVIVGNSSPVKNHIRALRAVQASLFDLYFHGDTTQASPEETKILDELEAAGRLRYRGTGDPADSLQKASLFLLPSKYEGMCIALAEALVVGLPAIVNDAPGVQWSRGFPNVIMVNDEQSVWNQAVLNASLNGIYNPEDGHLPFDLSAKRGAGELVEAYESLAPARGQ